METAKSCYQYRLLKKHYRKLDMDYIFDKIILNALRKNESYMLTSTKNTFFEMIYQKYGMLKCEICGAENLSRGTNRNIKNNQLATIEHVIPQSLGGLKFAFSNMICACSICNNKRDLLPLVKKGDLFVY